MAASGLNVQASLRGNYDLEGELADLDERFAGSS
jgi:hypothetical protein